MFNGVYDLHFATSDEERQQILRAVLQLWEEDAAHSASMRAFIKYMMQWWLPVPSAHFPDWQIYHTNIGMATTNNAVEQFNSVIKSVSFVMCSLS